MLLSSAFQYSLFGMLNCQKYKLHLITFREHRGLVFVLVWSGTIYESQAWLTCSRQDCLNCNWSRSLKGENPWLLWLLAPENHDNQLIHVLNMSSMKATFQFRSSLVAVLHPQNYVFIPLIWYYRHLALQESGYLTIWFKIMTQTGLVICQGINSVPTKSCSWHFKIFKRVYGKPVQI